MKFADIVEEAVKSQGSDLEKKLKSIAELVDHNNHTVAYEEGAALLYKLTKKAGYKKLQRIFASIATIAGEEGEMNRNLDKYRHEKYLELMKWAKQDLDKNDFNKFYRVY